MPPAAAAWIPASPPTWPSATATHSRRGTRVTQTWIADRVAWPAPAQLPRTLTQPEGNAMMTGALGVVIRLMMGLMIAAMAGGAIT